MEVPDSVVWFGPYRLTARIATGGMAEVYLGRRRNADGQLGTAVAVKRLLPHLVSDVTMVRMFLNEARITAQIDHPNVVRILDLGQEGREPFIAMELLEGRSLADLRQAGAEAAQRVPIGIFLRILTEACRGLDAAHRAVDDQGKKLSIVHRDFSPDNIHVGIDGQVKVIDFGIATASNISGGTEPGTLKGKFFYMSPEMIAGQPVDHRADLFAAGAMLYEQLCGRRPFTGLSTEQVLARITEGRPRRPSSFDPSVPPVLEAICLTALSHEPEGRFPSLKEFIHSLESVGGIAEIASPEQVGAYVNSLFPVERDPKRKLLREARQRDPSLPRFDSRPPEPAELAEAITRPPSEVGESLPPPNALEPAPSARPKRAWVGKALAGVAVVLVLAGMLVFRPWSGAPEPERTADDWRRQTETRLEAKDPDGALELARAYGEAFPKDAEAAVLEARAYVALRQGRKADAALDRASALDPKAVAPDVVRAELRQMQGDVGGALESLAQATKKAPQDRALQRRRALLLSQSGRLDEATSALTAVLQRRFDPESAAELAFVILRQDKSQRDDLKDAVTLLRKAIRRRPSFPEAHYYLGTALARLEDMAGAEKAYRDSVDQAPDDPRPLSALCQLLARSGRTADAAATRSLLSARFPDRAAGLMSECQP